jgi:hypothetical protein
LRGHTETIGERFQRDRAAMLPLPAAPYESCEKVTAHVSSLSLSRYRTNDYAVPTAYGHRQVLVKGYVHRVEIICGSVVIASHPRSYDRESAIYDPIHYLALLVIRPEPTKGFREESCLVYLLWSFMALARWAYNPGQWLDLSSSALVAVRASLSR